MKAADKLRVYYMRREHDMGGYHPLGFGTKSDLGFLLHALKPIIKELESRGYDPKTFRLSIEPQQGEQRFSSQRIDEARAKELAQDWVRRWRPWAPGAIFEPMPAGDKRALFGWVTRQLDQGGDLTCLDGLSSSERLALCEAAGVKGD